MAKQIQALEQQKDGSDSTNTRDSTKLKSQIEELTKQLQKAKQQNEELTQQVQLYKSQKDETEQSLKQDLTKSKGQLDEVNKKLRHAERHASSGDKSKIEGLKEQVRQMGKQIKGLMEQGESSAEKDTRDKEERKTLEHLYYLSFANVSYNTTTALSESFTKVIDYLLEHDYLNSNDYRFPKQILRVLFHSTRRFPNENELAMWLSQSCRMYDLFLNKFRPEDANTIQARGITIFTDEDADFLEEDGKANIKDGAVLKLFMVHLERLCFEIYKDLAIVISKSLRPRLLNTILEYSKYLQDQQNRPRRRNSIAIPRPVSQMPPADKFTDPTEILSKLSDCFKAVQKHFLYDLVVQQLFMQIYSYSDAVLFNTLFDGTHLCTCGNGFQIKLAIDKLEDWATNSKLIHASDQLKHISQAASVLVMVDKNLFKDAEMVKAVFPALNFGQIRHILDNFRIDQYCPEPVPQVVKLFLMHAAQLEEEKERHLRLNENEFLPLPEQG